MSVSCSDCGFTFENEDYNKACPKCGSCDRSVVLTEAIKLHEQLKLGKKGAASKKHKHKFDQELLTGKRVGKDGKLVSIDQVVDREQDVYRKTIKDEHGQIIVQKDEKLSEHR